MNVPQDLVDVFRRELEASRSLEAAVSAVATAVLARAEDLYALRVAEEEKRPPLHAQPSQARLAAVQKAVAAIYRKSPHRLFERRGTGRSHSTARWVAAAVLRRMDMSLQGIADVVGFRDHTAVLYGLRQVESRPELAEQAETVWRQISPAKRGDVPGPVHAEGVAA